MSSRILYSSVVSFIWSCSISIQTSCTWCLGGLTAIAFSVGVSKYQFNMPVYFYDALRSSYRWEGWFNIRRHLPDSYLSPVKRICVFEHSVKTNFNCACPAIQRGQGSGFLSKGSSWLIACMSEQRRFWRDCADAQARLSLRCSHMRWVPNSLDAVHFLIIGIRNHYEDFINTRDSTFSLSEYLVVGGDTRFMKVNLNRNIYAKYTKPKR